MRGPETAQFGMTLSLLARYFNYSGDSALLLKHRAKIEATAKLLADMHDESLSCRRTIQPRFDPRMERVGFVPDGGSVAVLAGHTTRTALSRLEASTTSPRPGRNWDAAHGAASMGRLAADMVET